MSTINHIMACKGGNFNDVAAGINAGAMGGITGWMTARIFTNLNPMVGLVFGVFSAIGGLVASSIVLHNEQIFGNNKREFENIAKYIIIFLSGIAAGHVGVALTGFQLAFETSLALGMLMVPISIITCFGLAYIYRKTL